MHVITRQRLQEFWHIHPDAERPLKAWLAIVQLKRYSSPAAVREDFASASFLGQWRSVFNIGGNKYRLVVDMRYDLGRISICHVLTHEEDTRRTQDGSLSRAVTLDDAPQGEDIMAELLDFTKPHVLRNEANVMDSSRI